MTGGQTTTVTPTRIMDLWDLNRRKRGIRKEHHQEFIYIPHFMLHFSSLCFIHLFYPQIKILPQFPLLLQKGTSYLVSLSKIHFLSSQTDYRMASNRAAWQNAVGEKLNVQSAPYTPPSENEIVIKNQAWAVNPIDWLVQENALFDWMKYPLITESDIAGEVVEVGSGVVRFKKGDRILAMSIGQDKNKPSEGAYQLYSVVQTVLAAPIPDSMSYAEAAVFPLGLCVAACGLFQQDQLALQHPTVPPKPTGKTIIVWGGASSVGSNAIQLAVAGGYEVFTTASLKNFDHLQKGRITESYPESMDPYRIIPLITESYPYTKIHPNMGYNSVICYCLGYNLIICEGDNPRSGLSDHRSKGFSSTAKNIR